MVHLIWSVWQGNSSSIKTYCMIAYVILIYMCKHRPFLADPLFVKKAAENRADEINTCIGCNQVRSVNCVLIGEYSTYQLYDAGVLRSRFQFQDSIVFS